MKEHQQHLPGAEFHHSFRCAGCSTSYSLLTNLSWRQLLMKWTCPLCGNIPGTRESFLVRQALDNECGECNVNGDHYRARNTNHTSSHRCAYCKQTTPSRTQDQWI